MPHKIVFLKKKKKKFSNYTLYTVQQIMITILVKSNFTKPVRLTRQFKRKFNISQELCQ